MRGNVKMPPKSATKSKNSQPIEFLNWELTKEEKSAAKAYDLSIPDVFKALERLVDDGYRVSIKRDDYHKSTNVSLTEPAPSGGGVARCIVSRGPTVVDAARVACFKHFVLLEGDWGNISAATLEGDGWG